MSNRYEQSSNPNTHTPHATYNPSSNQLFEYNMEMHTNKYIDLYYCPHAHTNLRPHSYCPVGQAPSLYSGPDVQYGYQAPTSSVMHTSMQSYDQAPIATPNHYQQQAVFEPQHNYTAQHLPNALPGYYSDYEIEQLRSWYPMPNQEPVPYQPSTAGVYNAWMTHQNP